MSITRKIDKITLSELLPRVFDGMQHTAPVSHSGVWLKDIELVRGRRYRVYAESGTGKSSLCSFIYGSRRDYLGTIRFNGTDIAGYSLSDWSRLRTRSLAYLPQELGLFSELTAMENIMIKNRLTDFLSAQQINQMLEQLEIDNRADYPAGRMSVGQRQRVAIIRALCQPFDFLLLDEPVSHLDERNNRLVARMVAEAADAQQAAIVTTSVGNHLLLDDVTTLTL